MGKYSKLIAVTNRHLCKGDYLRQIERVAALAPNSLILREKDLNKDEYSLLAKKVMNICKEHNLPCFIHSHMDVAEDLDCRRIHFSIKKLRENSSNLSFFEEVSVSCHSLEEVSEAISLGATQVVVGNIFETDCKKGLPGKGLSFLQEICKNSTVPVYGIGGIDLENLPLLLSVGAEGGCMMSGFMKL